MDFAYAENMTAEQLAAMDEFSASVDTELIHIGKQLDRVKALYMPLPATAASGKPVVHGANMQITGLQRYWEGRLRCVMTFVRREHANSLFDQNGIKVRV